MQVIDEQVELRLPVIDQSELAEQSAGSGQRAFGAEEARAGFDLSTGPLLRAKLLRLGPRRTCCCGNDAPHRVRRVEHGSAGQGGERVVRGLSGAEESPLAELPVQYADYAVWQREWLQGEVLEKQLAVLERQLAGAPVLELPTDRRAPAVRAAVGERGRCAWSSTRS